MSFVELDKRDGKLRITLTPSGRVMLQHRLDGGESIGTDAVLYALLEEHLGNGWEWIRPEELGALTSAPILSDECSRDEQGLLDQVGAVYWFPRYQIESPVE